MAFFLSDDLTQQDKIDELEKIRLLLKQYGSDAAEVANDAKLADEVARIIGHFSAGWDKKVSDTELFQIVQRCAMLIGQVLEFENEVDGNTETCSALVKNFCDKLVEGEKAGRGRVTTRVLFDMFQTCTFPVTSKAKYYIYCAWLNSCSKKNSTYLLELNKSKIDKLIEKWEKDWEINDADVRHLRRSYQLALHRLERFEQAATAMEVLLMSHPELVSDEATADAQTCIVQSLTTPATFRFDHLRELDVIQQNMGTPHGKLLEIFIAATNIEYQDFTAQHKLGEMGFTEADIGVLDEKMKLLTLVALAEQSPDVLYRTVEEKLSLDEEACEDLAVKAFQLKLLRGRLDQGNERITTTYAIKRDFTEGDWLDLKNKLDLWQQNLEQVKENIKEVEELAVC